MKNTMKIAGVLFLLLPFVLTNCEGCKGEKTHPTVTSVTPASNAEKIEPDVIITATFDKIMSSTSITTDTFTVDGGAGKIAGKVSSTGRNATFTPTTNIGLLTKFKATLTKGVKDVDGNSLAKDYSWTFTTRDGAWGDVTQVETETGDSLFPHIAADPNGNAVAVWVLKSKDSTPITTTIKANRFTDKTKWDRAEVIDVKKDETENSLIPQVVIDSNGNAIAVWARGKLAEDGTVSGAIWANHYVVDKGWEGAKVIGQESKGGAFFPCLAIEANGNALALWAQRSADGSPYTIWANTYTADKGWGAAKIIASAAGAGANPQVAFDKDGNAIAVWEQKENTDAETRFNIWANTYTKGKWGKAEVIQQSPEQPAVLPQVAFDGKGNAIAIWQQSLDDKPLGPTIIWANRYADGKWGKAVKIEDSAAGSSIFPHLAVDPAGNAIAVWAKLGSAKSTLWTNRYTVDSKSSSWGKAEALPTSGEGNALIPRIAMDLAGNAVVIWSQGDKLPSDDATEEAPEHDIWTIRYTLGKGWGTAEKITSTSTKQAALPQVAVNAGGKIFTIWSEKNSNGIIKIRTKIYE